MGENDGDGQKRSEKDATVFGIRQPAVQKRLAGHIILLVVIVGLAVRADGYNIFVTGEVGSGRSTVVRRTLGELVPGAEEFGKYPDEGVMSTGKTRHTALEALDLPGALRHEVRALDAALPLTFRVVRDILSDPVDHAMVRAINKLGQLLGKETIAEGVENDAQIEFLRARVIQFFEQQLDACNFLRRIKHQAD